MTVHNLADLNAILNTISTMFLLIGFYQIKSGNRERHKKFMLAALTTSLLFLTSYVIYHANVGSVAYPYNDWTRPIYFAILIPHVILAVAQLPFIVMLVWWAFHGKFDKHKKLARIVWPVWMFVSVSGVTVYLMLYGL